MVDYYDNYNTLLELTTSTYDSFIQLGLYSSSFTVKAISTDLSVMQSFNVEMYQDYALIKPQNDTASNVNLSECAKYFADYVSAQNSIESTPLIIADNEEIAVISFIDSGEFTDGQIEQLYDDSDAEDYIIQMFTQTSENTYSLSIETSITSTGKINELVRYYVSNGIQDINVNNNLNITNQYDSFYLYEQYNEKISLQSIISDLSASTKKIAKSNTSNLYKLINSGIANISDISMGKTKVGTSTIYFGSVINDIVTSGLNSVYDDYSGVGQLVDSVANENGEIITAKFDTGKDFVALLSDGNLVTSTLDVISTAMSKSPTSFVTDSDGVYSLENGITNGKFNVTKSKTTDYYALSTLKTTISSSTRSLISNVFGTKAGAYLGTYSSISSKVASLMIDPYWMSSIVMDLDGNGLQTTALTDSSIYFDIDGNGLAEKTAWISSNDGFLVLDKNGNGQIDNANEIIGNNASSGGFVQLKTLDTNKDNIINDNDAAFSELMIWKDLDSDGNTDTNELTALSNWDIASIDLNCRNTQVQDNGNYISQISGYTKSDETKYLFASTNLAVNKLDSYNKEGYEIDSSVLSLPWLRGYGSVKDLPQAMSENAALVSYVTSLTEETDAKSLYSKMDILLAKWAGVESISSRATNSGTSARSVAILEKFLNITIKNDSKNASTINNLYTKLKISMYVDFLGQTAQGEQIGLSYNFADNTFSCDQDTLFEYLNCGTSDNFNNYVANIAGAIVSLNLILDSNTGKSIKGTSSNETICGFGGNDSITAYAGNDLIIGGAGKDTLNGGSGNDKYNFNIGDGQDTIIDDYLISTKYGSAGTDTIQFGTGITKDDLVATKVGNDLIISIKDTTDKITVRNQFNDNGTNSYYSFRTIENYVFADETTLSSSDIMDMVQMTGTSKKDTIIGGFGDEELYGDAGNDSIVGNADNDYIVGGSGNDTLNGGKGNDTYIFNSGDGKDTIYEYFKNGSSCYSSGTDDILIFGEGITKDNLIVTKSGNDLIISIKESTDKITIVNQLYGNRIGIEKFCFNDGTLLYNNEISNMIQIMGTESADTIKGTYYKDSVYGDGGNDSIIGLGGNDSIISYTGDDTITGGTGNDTLIGDNGNDTYIFNIGDGKDTICDYLKYSTYCYSNGLNDTLQFGEGITKDDLSVTKSGNDLIISINGTDDKITIQNQLYGQNFESVPVGVGIETFVFSNGSTMTKTEIFNMINLPATNTGDTINADSGYDTIYGSSADNTYVFGKGDSLDILTDNGGNDLIKFESSIDLTQVAVYTDSSNLYIDYGTSAGVDRITVRTWNYTRNQIEKIQLADGLYITNTEINQIVQDMAAFASSNSLQLTSVNNVKNNQDLMNIVASAWHS